MSHSNITIESEEYIFIQDCCTNHSDDLTRRMWSVIANGAKDGIDIIEEQEKGSVKRVSRVLIYALGRGLQAQCANEHSDQATFYCAGLIEHILLAASND